MGSSCTHRIFHSALARTAGQISAHNTTIHPYHMSGGVNFDELNLRRNAEEALTANRQRIDEPKTRRFPDDVSSSEVRTPTAPTPLGYSVAMQQYYAQQKNPFGSRLAAHLDGGVFSADPAHGPTQGDHLMQAKVQRQQRAALR